MTPLQLPDRLIDRIHAHLETAYPDEGAGFLLGSGNRVDQILPISNAREAEARHNRFLIRPQDYLAAENRADELGLVLMGVFHSHPDQPNNPSEYDREWAQPFFSYLITTVDEGRAGESRCWKLAADRSRFEEQPVELVSGPVGREPIRSLARNGIPRAQPSLRMVDHAELRSNQVAIIAFTVLAFILNLPVLASGVAVALGVGSMIGRPGFGFLYRAILRPLGLIRPEILEDNPGPHRFSQALAFAFLAVGSTLVLLGWPTIGWSLAWVVIGLAALNAFAGFCAGCVAYYWLARLAVPGFSGQPPPGSPSGVKPGSGKIR